MKPYLSEVGKKQGAAKIRENLKGGNTRGRQKVG